jgi:putative spermidine/putrescine transport system permease protein
LVPIAALGPVCAALFAFLTGVRVQSLPVRIRNSLHLEIEPTIAAFRAFPICKTGLVLLVDALLSGRCATCEAQRCGPSRDDLGSA